MLCPHSNHTLAAHNAKAMQALYPVAQGSWHCDGCGEGAAALAVLGHDRSVYHCAEGCAYALCGSCAVELLDMASCRHRPTTKRYY